MVCKDLCTAVGWVFLLAFTVLFAFVAGYWVKYYLWMERDDNGNLVIRDGIERVDATHFALGLAVVIPLYVTMILLVKLFKGDLCCCCKAKDAENETLFTEAIRASMYRPQAPSVVVINNGPPHPTQMEKDPMRVYYPTMAQMPSPLESLLGGGGPTVEMIED